MQMVERLVSIADGCGWVETSGDELVWGCVWCELAMGLENVGVSYVFKVGNQIKETLLHQLQIDVGGTDSMPKHLPSNIFSNISHNKSN